MRTPYVPARVSAVPREFADDPATGVHSGAELQRRREARPTPERITRLEHKQDANDQFKAAVGERLGKLEGAVTGLDSKVDILIDLHRQDREDRRAEVGIEKIRLSSRARVIVALAGMVGALFSAIAYGLYALAKGWG